MLYLKDHHGDDCDSDDGYDNDCGDDDDDDKCHNYSERCRELQQEMSFKIYFAD